ncbi:SEC-C domain-containing protein [Dactylosporangium sp. AC04546]|uniref:SEC-C metal-binding domain-containing protein n=1 Tax=Dactylosporangium sp. AC04546 TaxID=2862460 RepID=UPI001EE0099E|nr:SEC-C metal-binding domain-containing protein [Dactylosporangium sp. AC04546]WVK89689.1 SEC-C domain-containing protein [Dactylosporangium sp. AC04546]
MDVLTTAELADLHRSALGAANPLGVAAELAGAVDQGRLADPDDAGYALTLAAEIAESRGKLDAALRYADRAVTAYGTDDDSRAGFARALRARILLRLGGRDEEAMGELTALRPLLTKQPDAAAYLSAALDAGRRADLAEQWLSDAVESLLAERAMPAEPSAAEASGALFFLLQQRHRVRHELGLPHDQNDKLADRLESELAGRAEEAAAEPTALVFWPRAAFDRLLPQWPTLSDKYGQDWDEHRARLERELVRLADAGRSGLTLLTGSIDGLADYSASRGGDPADLQVHAGYTEQLAGQTGQIQWPPARNEPCWCGSGNKYKKCCLPRARG